MKTAIAKTAPKATSKVQSKPVPKVRVKKLHPAEQAGMVVHQTVESGVVAVKDTVSTAGEYVFGFVKGLIKGH